jgi:hypothetical protein
MLSERAFRFVDAAYVDISAYDFFAPRMIALLNQTSEARRVAAIAGKPLNPQPRTLTGDDWRAACEAQNREADEALDAVY